MYKKFSFWLYSKLPIFLKKIIYFIYKIVFFRSDIQSNLNLLKTIKYDKKFESILKSTAKNTLSHNKFISFIEGFLNDDLLEMKKVPLKDGAVAISVIKDELEKVTIFFDNLNKIKIKNILIIDNGSPNEVINYLLTKELTLFSVNNRYNSSRKNGWINRIIRLLDLKNWILVLDSDEQFIYPSFKHESLDTFLLKSQNSTQFNSLMVDLHTSYKDIEKSFQLKELFFYNKYFLNFWFTGNRFLGGSKILINNFLKSNVNPNLAKIPLFKMDKKRVYLTHNHLPIDYNFSKQINTFVIHYQFIFNSSFDFTSKVRKGDYFNNNIEYLLFNQTKFSLKDLYNELHKNSTPFDENSIFNQINIK